MQKLWAGLCLLAFAMSMPESYGQMPTEEPSGQFSSEVGQPVSAAAELIKTKQFAAALTKLEAVLSMSGLTDHENSTIWQMKGGVLYELERFNDAAEAFKLAIEFGGLTPATTRQSQLQIAQLLILGGQFADGAKAFEAWHSEGGALNDQQLEILIQAWIKAEQTEKALVWAIKWYDAAQPKTRKHFDLMNYLYYQMGDSHAQIQIVKDMINRWPEDRELWDNLASLFASNDQEYDAFILNQLMYSAGFFTSEREVLKLVQYYGYYEIPFQGAQTLDHELNGSIVSASAANLKILSNLWLQAREYDRAIPVLVKITDVKPDKTSYAQLGESLIKRGDCEGAEAAFQNAIGLGYSFGKAWMLIGTCRYEVAQLLEKPTCRAAAFEGKQEKRYRAQEYAKSAFENVTVPISLKIDAQKWIRFISAEQAIIDEQCGFIGAARQDLCFIVIGQAEDSRFMNDGELRLNDQSCEVFVDDFYAKYGAKAVQD